ncbi:hypothetical protein [Streptomyces sp. NPDC088246]|uniref:hypothetical protein n=1 Tax=Streptomyces sp. NPDC088246 TaxID=3365842 RepID=UPI0038251F4E
MRCPNTLHQRLHANLLACLHHPIGLDLDTVTPKDTAFSIPADRLRTTRRYGRIADPDGHARPQGGARPQRAGAFSIDPDRLVHTHAPL